MGYASIFLGLLAEDSEYFNSRISLLEREIKRRGGAAFEERIDGVIKIVVAYERLVMLRGVVGYFKDSLDRGCENSPAHIFELLNQKVRELNETKLELAESITDEEMLKQGSLDSLVVGRSRYKNIGVCKGYIRTLRRKFCNVSYEKII